MLSDFSGGMNKTAHHGLLPSKYAAESYNFDFSDGSLKPFHGVQKFSAGGNPLEIEGETLLSVYHFKRFDRDLNLPDDRIAVYCQSGKVYGFSALHESSPVLLDVTFDKMPQAVNYRLNGEDVLVLSSGATTAVWDGVNPVSFAENAPEVTSLCVHYERLFASGGGDRSAIWFSDDLDITNWNVSLDEAGFLELADEGGGLLKVVHFLDYVYVFRDYGIARLSAYADQTQFSLTRLYTGTGRIFGDTVTVCGDRIVFLASDGLYTFDGISARRTAKALDGFLNLSKGKPVAAAYLGDYILSAFGNFETAEGSEENFVNNALIFYNSSTGKTTVMRGMDACGLTVFNQQSKNKLLMTLRNKNTCSVCELSSSPYLFQSPLKMLWKTPYTDFGKAETIKRAKHLYCDLHGEALLTVETDCEKKSYALKGDGLIRKPISVKGRRFCLTFTSVSPEVTIAKPELTAEYL